MAGDPDDHEIEPAQFFTLTGWSTRIFGRKRRVARKIQGTYLVGGELESDGTTIPRVTSSRGLLVDLSVVGSGIVPAAWSGVPSPAIGDTTAAVGDHVVIGQAGIAGNASISFPTATPTSAQLWEAYQLLYIAQCDATVATRTPRPLVSMTLGFTSPVNVTAIDDFLFAASLPSLTASQEGRVFAARSPALVQLNDNATITTGAASPLPILFNTNSVNFSCTLTAGVAGDLHAMAVWCRRIA